MSIDVGHLREQYSNAAYKIEDAAEDPFTEFSSWFATAKEAKLKEPNAMTLATVDEQGHADARIVLLKEMIDHGFVFYTNYSSAKGQQIFANPHGCLVFVWLELERQVRIKGVIKKYDANLSEKYFQSRPKNSQIAAWASPQSKQINREDLESMVAETTLLFEDKEVLPKPPQWGGYILEPAEVEFWQGRRNRLHDRVKYFLKDGKWSKVRLAP
jgi:pyridoxamine 5'-phosphate oxidase